MGWTNAGTSALKNAIRNPSALRAVHIQTALFAGTQALGILTAPGVKSGSFAEAFNNEASEAKPYSFFAGTNKIVPNLTWYGDFARKKVKNDNAVKDILLMAGVGGLGGYVAGGGTFGIGALPDPPTAYIGLAEGAVAGGVVAGLGSLRAYSFRYYSGWAYTLGHGRIDAVREVWSGDTLVGRGLAGNAGSTMLCDTQQAFGGDHEEGGVYWLCDIVPGDLWPLQQPNPYLQSQVAGAPAFSGKALFIIRGPAGFDESGYFAAGANAAPQVRPLSLVVQRFPNNLGVPAFKQINTDDANVVEVAYDWLTGRTRNYGYGGRVPLAKFNINNWRAAAETIHGEGLGFSAEANQNIGVLDYLEELCSFGGMAVWENPRTAEIDIKLIRRNYSLPLAKTFDDSNVEEVTGYSPGTHRDAPNEIRFVYKDRDNNYKERPYIQQNDAALRQTGEVVTRTLDFPGVGCAETAQIIGPRELLASSPRPPFTLKVKASEAEDVEFMEVVKWAWSKYNVTHKSARVVGIEPGDSSDDRVTLTLVEDVFGRGDAINGTPAETEWQSPTATAVAITDERIQEAPYFLSRADEARLLVAAAKPNSAQFSYDAHTSTDGTTYAESASAVEFTPKAALVGDIARLTEPTLTELVVEIADTLTAALIASVTDADKAAGAALIQIDDEWMSYSTVVNNGDGTLTLGDVTRAQIDSVPLAHSDGADVWFFGVERVVIPDTFADGTLTRTKLTANTLTASYPVASAAANNHTIAERALKPYPVRGVTVDGDYLTELQPSGDVVVGWEPSNRINEGLLTEQTDTGLAAESGTTYEIKIYGETLTLLRTVTQGTIGYTYTNAFELADTGKSRLEFSLEFRITTIRGGERGTTYYRSLYREDPADIENAMVIDGEFVEIDGELVIES